MKWLRIGFAVVSWFLAFGLLVIAVRQPEMAAGVLFMAVVFVANGWLHWRSAS